jgi:hypothetical protein
MAVIAPFLQQVLHDEAVNDMVGGAHGGWCTVRRGGRDSSISAHTVL